jgi:signal transduction histidine kinase
MSLRQRLVGSFVLVTILLLIPAVLAVVRLNTLREMAVEGREQHAAASLALGRFATAVSELDRLQRSYLVTGDTILLRGTRTALDDLRDQIPPLGEPIYLGAPSSLAPVVDALATASARIEALVRDGEQAQADQVFAAMVPLMSEAQARLATLATSIDRHAEEDFVRARAIISSARTEILFFLFVSSILTLLLAVWVTQAIVAPLRRLAEAMAEVTGGTLEAPADLPYERGDEVGDLTNSFRTMTLRLAELDRMKAEFLGVAGHELKTPIAAIAGFSALIEEELAGELTENQQQILSTIAEQSRIMTRLVNRLMDISRLESGSFRMELESTHIEDLVTGLVRSFDVLAAEKDIRIHTVIEDSAPETLVVDVDLVRSEVLGNLVSNAVKFSPEGGEVRIRAWGEEDLVVFEVSDTGPGIPEQHRAHVFEKYYQVERSRRVGSGLGLAITRDVARLHGGEVRLVETAAPGATFQVRLPVRPPTESGEPLPEDIPDGERASPAPVAAVQGD